MRDIAPLAAHLAGLGRVILGYSGGVDSALLAVVAARTLGPDRFLAVIGRSASYPEVQWRQALGLAERFSIPLRELDTQELGDPRYQANTVDRCYHCKSELWRRLGALAGTEGYGTVIDGTNDDDLREHRPGLRAAGEHRVGSPLAELGWTKAEVRESARGLGIPAWDAPASPCLSSRIRYGLAVTPERLRQVERGEALLRAAGVTGDLRLRHHDTHARIEVSAMDRALVEAAWDRLEPALRALGFDSVELDPRGYRRGGLLVFAGGA